ncbi:MAG: hypothetical protein RBT22_06080 [Aliarcobacter sp.]|jgi:hypothetical protein|nr:hypothetical protein [Aliarcobacter sp.]
MIESQKTQRDNLVKNWFYNLKHMGKNKEILLICCDDKKLNLETLINSYLINHKEVSYVNYINKFKEEELQNNKDKNIILLNNSDINLIWLDIFKNENLTILFCNIKNQEELAHLITHNSNSMMSENPIQPHLFYIKKIELSSILNNPNIIEDIIKILMTDDKNAPCRFSKSSIKRYLYRGKDSIDLNRIHKDISYFKATYNLTSRLAIFIFKICTFYFSANEKTIGLDFANTFGKSKILNNKKFDISNTKGYSTMENNYDNVQFIKKDIAIKLQTLNKLNNEEIFFATGINLDLLK